MTATLSDDAPGTATVVAGSVAIPTLGGVGLLALAFSLSAAGVWTFRPR